MKKILNFVLAFCMLIPCAFLLGACGKEKYTISYDNNFEHFGTFSEASNGQVQLVEEGATVTYEVHLKNYYDRDTLKIYANDKQIAFVKGGEFANDTAYANRTLSTDANTNFVGTFTLSNIKESTTIRYEVEEQKINLSTIFDVNDTNVINSHRAEMLADLKLGEEYGNKSLADINNYALEHQEAGAVDNSIKLSYVKLFSDGITLTSSHYVGYYEMNQEDMELFHNLGYFEGDKYLLQPVIKTNSKEYVLKINSVYNPTTTDSLLVKASDATSILRDNAIHNYAGNIISKVGDSEKYVTIGSYASGQEVLLNKDAGTPVVFNLDPLGELRDYAYFYINGTKIGKINTFDAVSGQNNVYTYTIAKDKYPINYTMENADPTDFDLNAFKLYVILEGDLSQVQVGSNLLKATIEVNIQNATPRGFSHNSGNYESIYLLCHEKYVSNYNNEYSIRQSGEGYFYKGAKADYTDENSYSNSRFVTISFDVWNDHNGNISVTGFDGLTNIVAYKEPSSFESGTFNEMSNQYHVVQTLSDGTKIELIYSTEGKLNYVNIILNLGMDDVNIAFNG